MDFDRLRLNWTNLGAQDPLWAILSEPAAIGGKWHLEDFLATGAGFCRWAARHVEGLGVSPPRQRALDFGCGYGRLTQPLADYFDEVVGVDIAEPMLEGARRINQRGERCSFVRNDTPDLRQFDDESFDFVLSVLVLQHMLPDYAEDYIREFVRVLRPGGVAFFQVSSDPLVPAAAAAAAATGDVTIATAPHHDLSASLAVHPGFFVMDVREWKHFRVDVANLGSRSWEAGPGPFQVAVGWRWHDAEGNVLTPATWQPLHRDIAPGARGTVLVPVRALGQIGYHVLRLVVGEVGRWVESTACPSVSAPIRIKERIHVDASEPDQPPPLPIVPQHDLSDVAAEGERIIQVHGLPTARVCRAVVEAGGEVVDVSEDGWAGPAWISAHYTVRKR